LFYNSVIDHPLVTKVALSVIPCPVSLDVKYKNPLVTEQVTKSAKRVFVSVELKLFPNE
jgi:hypothetical protein